MELPSSSLVAAVGAIPRSLIPARTVSLEELAVHVELAGDRMLLGSLKVRDLASVVAAVGPARTALALADIGGRILPPNAQTMLSVQDADSILLAVMVDDAHTLAAMCQRAERALALPAHVEGRVCPVGIGLGVSKPSRHPAAVRIGEAQEAAAQTDGRRRVVVYDLPVADRARQLAELAPQLPDLFDDGALVMHGQPVFDIRVGTPVMVECLARLAHPDLGLLGPEVFLDAVRSVGLMGELRRVALRHAAANVERLRAVVPDITVSINVTAADMQDPQMLDDVDCALAQAATTHGWLVIEVVETDLAISPGIDHVVDGLKARRVQLAIDDFGSGYSSLRQFRDLHADIVKVDRHFVAELDGVGGHSSVFALAKMLADARRLTLIAEGVESTKQLAELRALGCRYVQGHLLGRPVPLAEFRPDDGL